MRRVRPTTPHSRCCSPMARSMWRPGRPKRRAASPPNSLPSIEAVIAPLARVAEIRALRRTAGNLIDTYVGHQTGERILSGKIRRGYVEAIRAAIWLSDMRGFTTLSEQLPPQALIDRLNLYFECQVPAILNHGGEVLKFMGDGLLAIFPIGNDSDTVAVCGRTLSCAREFRARIAELPREDRKRGCDPLRASAPRRRGDVRQYRRRQPPRFHLHRTGGEPRGAAGEGRRQAWRSDRGIRGLCRSFSR